MDFVDWREQTAKPTLETEQEKQAAAQRGRRMGDYVEEMIREAQARGDFDNLVGIGKPLPVDMYQAAGDNGLAYSLLKNNGYAPPEVELLKHIDTMLERAQAKAQQVVLRIQRQRANRFSVLTRGKPTFTVTIDTAAREYDEALRRINKEILTLNISTPTPMHRPTLKVDELVQAFRAACAIPHADS